MSPGLTLCSADTTAITSRVVTGDGHVEELLVAEVLHDVGLGPDREPLAGAAELEVLGPEAGHDAPRRRRADRVPEAGRDREVEARALHPVAVDL